MSFIVRRGMPFDIEWMVGECHEFAKFYGTDRPVFTDGDHGAKAIKAIMDNHLVLVCEHRDKPVGFIVGLVTPHLFNPNLKMLAEILWWVKPEHRSGRAALMLLGEFIEWGKKNVHWITLALEARTPIKESALERRGFKLQEKNYLMEVSA